MITNKHQSILVLGIVFCLILLAKNALWTKPKVQASDLTLENILSAVNQERAANNLPTLNSDTRLANAAQEKATDMQTRHYFSHTDPEGNYIWGKIAAAGYTPYLQLGENLAIEFFSTESLMSAWMNSPTHRANILTPGFKDQGMGIQFGQANAGQYGSAIANTFGTLLPAKAKVQPTPKAPVAKLTKPKAVPKVPSKPLPKTVTSKKPPAPLSAQTEAPKESNSSPTPVNLETPSPIASQTPAEIFKTPTEPFRGDKLAQQDYSLPENTKSQDLPQTIENLNSEIQIPQTNPAKTNQPSDTGKVGTNSSQNNSNIILILGIFILLVLLGDLQKFFNEKLLHLDKKINNLVLLILSLLIIGFIYFL